MQNSIWVHIKNRIKLLISNPLKKLQKTKAGCFLWRARAYSKIILFLYVMIYFLSREKALGTVPYNQYADPDPYPFFWGIMNPDPDSFIMNTVRQPCCICAPSLENGVFYRDRRWTMFHHSMSRVGNGISFRKNSAE
jgi:hypothetical protein